jgi:hypothetical protein
MKPLKVLILFCIICGYGSINLMSQFPVKTNYHDLTKIKSAVIVSPGSFIYQGHIPVLYPLSVNKSMWTGIPGKPDFYFNVPFRNYFEVISEPALFYFEWHKSTEKSMILDGFRTSGTLSGEPFLTTPHLYYSPLKITNKTNLSDYRLYRITGFVIPKMLNSIYPGAPIIEDYPKSYLQPRHSTTDKSW